MVMKMDSFLKYHSCSYYRQSMIRFEQIFAYHHMQGRGPDSFFPCIWMSNSLAGKNIYLNFPDISCESTHYKCKGWSLIFWCYFIDLDVIFQDCFFAFCLHQSSMCNMISLYLLFAVHEHLKLVTSCFEFFGKLPTMFLHITAFASLSMVK